MQDHTIAELAAAGVTATVIGRVTSSPTIGIPVEGHECIRGSMMELRDIWEETMSFDLEKLQRLKSCVKADQDGLKKRTKRVWKLLSISARTSERFLRCEVKPKVTVIREEGSNGDGEMSAIVHAAGFEPWDISMSDILTQKVNLKDIRGTVFVGGFSYADVLDSGKGWAACTRFNDALLQQCEELYRRPDTFSLGVFACLQCEELYRRPDTFSLGVCDGRQLMALLGWVPGIDYNDVSQPQFIHNESGRFECRFGSVTMKESPAINVGRHGWFGNWYYLGCPW